MEDDFNYRQQKEQSHTEAYRDNQQRAVHHRTNLSRQHCKVRFCHSDKHSHKEGYGKQDAQFAGFGQAFADILTHRGHRHVSTEIEEADACNQQQG